MPVIAGGFFVYYILPGRLRLPFLFSLNVITLFVLFEPVAAVYLLVICLGIFGILSLPTTIRNRVVLLIILGGTLLYIRTSFPSFETIQGILPFVGAVFMFRAILYIHEMRLAKGKVSFWKRINYFFLLPNWVFLIFPVVDFKTFHRNYQESVNFQVIQKGLRWMALGALHLFFYRILYYYFMPAPSELHGIFDLGQYLIIGYGLTLRLSGLFHFSVGVICLFGFELPPAFTNHFLANGFSDLWRRINIYWKDFMMKVFYFPIYFRIKKIGATKALMITVLIVFFFNWFLHSYQWLWLRGSFLITAPDVIFWGIFGLLVAANAVFQKRKKKRVSPPYRFSGKLALNYALQVSAMFTFMCVFWSLWTSPSLAHWTSLFGSIAMPGTGEIALLCLGFCLVILSGVVLQYLHFRLQEIKFPYDQQPFRRLLYATLGVLFIISFPPIQHGISNQFQFDMEPVLSLQLNQYDREQQFKGYYETLVLGNNFTSTMWDLERDKPQDWQAFHKTGMLIKYSKQNYRELKPNQFVMHKGALIVTNAYGFRDKLYSLMPSAQTTRVALIGNSIDMGIGVENEETYEQIVEDQIQNLEILNFSTPGFLLPSYIPFIKNKVLDFQPDYLWITEHQVGISKIVSILGEKIYSHPNATLPPFLDSLVKEMPSRNSTSQASITAFLNSRRYDILAYYYKEVISICKDRDIIPVLLYCQGLNKKPEVSERAKLFSLARKLGFHVLDLSQVFDPVSDRNSLHLGKWDTQHPNKEGHQLMAKAIHKQFLDILQQYEK